MGVIKIYLIIASLFISQSSFSQVLALKMKVYTDDFNELSISDPRTSRSFDNQFVMAEFRENFSSNSFEIKVFQEGLETPATEIHSRLDSKNLEPTYFINLKENTEFLRLTISSKNHKDWNRNLTVGDSDTTFLTLGSIYLEPSSIRVEKIKRGSKPNSSVYEVTIKNFTSNEVLVTDCKIRFYKRDLASCDAMRTWEYYVLADSLTAYVVNDGVTGLKGKFSKADDRNQTKFSFGGKHSSTCGMYSALLLELDFSMVLPKAASN